MRITIEIDPDFEALLRQAMQQSGQSFETVLNQAIRRGLADMAIPSDEPPFEVKARNLGPLRPGIDPRKLQQLADEMEIDAYLEVTRKLDERLSKQDP